MHFLRRFAIIFVILLIVIVAGVLAVQLAPRTYKVTRLQGSPQAFWNDHEAFFVVSEGTTGTSSLKWLDGARGTYAIVLSAMTTDWVSFGQKHTIRHYADGQMTTTSLDGAYGLFIPSGEYLYFSSYTDRGKALRYESGKFVPAPVEEGKMLISVESDTDDDEDGQVNPRMPRGWKSAHLYNATPVERRIEIKLKNAELWVSVPPIQARNPQAPLTFEPIAMPIATLRGTGLADPIALNSPSKVEYLTRAEFEARKRTLAAGQRCATPLATSFRLLTCGILLVFLLIPLLLKFFLGKSLKRRVVDAVPNNYSFPSAIPEQFPQLDRVALENASVALERMGFTRVMDYSATPDSGRFVPGFARLMTHTRENIFAEINQVFPPGKKPIVLGTVLVSLMEDDWKLSTQSRAPLPAQYLLRRPRALWKALPGATADQLWSSHMEMRTRMQQDLGVRVLSDLSPQRWFSQMTEANAKRKEALKGKTMSRILFEANFARVKPQDEWLGDWAKIAAERAKAAGFSQQG